MQLLQITVTPTKYELDIERARLEYKQDFVPNPNMKTEQAEIAIKTEPTQLNIDSYQARASIGLKNSADQMQQRAQQGQEGISQYTAEQVSDGQQMANIEDGVTIASIIREKVLEQAVSYTAFLPSGSVDLSWVPPEISFEYSGGTVNYDWQVKKNEMSYIPGSVRMRIVEHPSVDIEYVGTPIYIPRSSDPNYEEPA